MKSFVPTDLQKLAIDAYNGVSSTYSKEDLQDALRNAIVEALGGEWSIYKFMDNKGRCFQILSDIMAVNMNQSLADKFANFADFKDVALGDKPYFFVDDPTVYPMYAVSRGNQDIERHKVIKKNFSVATETVAIKFYDELDLFITGKASLADFTNRAMVAYENYVGNLIATTIYGSYSSVGTNYKATGAFVASDLNDIIEHVQAATSVENIQIWGTPNALANIADDKGYSDGAKDVANRLGYYGSFRGHDMMKLPQAYTAGTQTFAVNRDYVIILPANEKIVKVVLEGAPYIYMKDGSERNDQQPEIFFSRMIGAAAITVNEGNYGIYKFS
jgi:hypothetical protein